MAKQTYPERKEVSGPPDRTVYEAGGWKDGRLGQAYDLLAAVLGDRGERPFRNPLLDEIESLDEQVPE